MPHRLTLALLLAGAPQVFLRPLEHTVVAQGPLAVVAHTGAAELTLDGKAVVAAHPAPGVLTATVNPAPGRHELAVGGAAVRFFVGAAGAPAGWKEFHAHPPQAACDTCHNGAWDVKVDACFQCHDQKAFPKIHQHASDTLADCQDCHAVHGSTEPHDLVMPKEQACKQCHG